MTSSQETRYDETPNDESMAGATRTGTLLVVAAFVALGILAAIVIPRSAPTPVAPAESVAPNAPAGEAGTADAPRVAAAPAAPAADTVSGPTAAKLASNLATVRHALELYKAQHDDAYPGTEIIAQLTGTTDASGDSEGSSYGPYLGRTFPSNPVNGSGAIRMVDAMPGQPVGDEGWLYCPGTGEFRANSPGEVPGGPLLFDL